MSYHPDNTYCYALDSKSKTELKLSIRRMATCFDNIFVLDKEYDFDSSGHGQDRAHFDCMEILMDRKWDHAILLQNYDMIIKSLSQLSDLSELLNYTSLMGLEHAFPQRFDHSIDWTPAVLKIFKNETDVPKWILNKKLVIKKSLNEIIVSKMFIKSIFEKINLDNVIAAFDKKRFYGVDEMLIMTLFGNYLGLDGQMETMCRKSVQDPISRLTFWRFGSSKFTNQCKSKLRRHGICVLGVEYLRDLKNTNFVIANKALANFDFGTHICIREMIKQNQGSRIADEEFLNTIPQFFEMKLKSEGLYKPGNINC